MGKWGDLSYVIGVSETTILNDSRHLTPFVTLRVVTKAGAREG